MGLAERIAARTDEIVGTARERLPIAADAYEAELRVVLSTPGTRANPSRPGEAPHKVTGELVGSVFKEVFPGSDVALVGTSAPHGKYLVDSRPYLEIAHKRCEDKMRAIMFDDL